MYAYRLAVTTKVATVDDSNWILVSDEFDIFIFSELGENK